MKIVYFSVTRYPTEKAYGVTVFYTMKALEDLGHKPLVISPNNFTEFGKSSMKRSLIESLWNWLFRLRPNERFMGKIIFIFKRINAALLSKYIIPFETEILWLRDPIVGLLTYRKINYTKIVLEVHQSLNFYEKCIAKWLQHKNILILAPISIAVQNSLVTSKFHFIKDQMVLSPMGVPNSFLTKIERGSIGLESNRFVIGYVGGIKSSGVDQGIFTLITCFQNINFRNTKIKLVLKIYGIEPEYISIIESQFSELVSTGGLVLEMRQNHEILLPKLRMCDAFILPYPEGDYFKNRFPLKALEYAALRRPILVTETISHLNIFNNDEVWFYNPGNCTSLFEAVIKVIDDPKEVSFKIELAYDKALSHSYSTRASAILSKI